MLATWDRERILSGLSPEIRAHVPYLAVHPVLDSTNSYLLAKAAENWPSGAVCFAEQQTGGRGRQGRSWISPIGAGLALSLLWRLPATAASGLSLVTGIAVARTMRSLGVTDVGLKWPNDVQWQGRKLGGILLESGGRDGSFHVVAGIGLNIALPHSAVAAIGQPAVDLCEILGKDRVPECNDLASAVINALISAFLRFTQHGFAEWVSEWATFDVLNGQQVRLLLPNSSVVGIARGVETTGALLLETSTGITPYIGGEISLRLEETV